MDQLLAFASEVTRVVGTQGILGGQARVEGVQGTWADLTRNFNVCQFFPFIQLVLISMMTENGFKFDQSSAIHLRSYKGCCTW